MMWTPLIVDALTATKRRLLVNHAIVFHASTVTKLTRRLSKLLIGSARKDSDAVWRKKNDR